MKIVELRNENKTAYNKRFGEIGVKVIARTSVRSLTISDNPNGVQSSPNFAKPPGRCRQAAKTSSRKYLVPKMEYSPTKHWN